MCPLPRCEEAWEVNFSFCGGGALAPPRQAPEEGILVKRRQGEPEPMRIRAAGAPRALCRP